MKKRSEDQIQRIREDNQNRRSDKRGIFRDQCGARVHDKITDMTQEKANQIRDVKLTRINAQRISHEKRGLKIKRR